MKSFSLTLAFAALCGTGLAQVPPQFSSIQKLTNAEAQLKLSGLAASKYRIDVSTNGINWSAFVTLGGVVTNQHTDSAAPYFPSRFYRAEERTGANVLTGDHIITDDGDVVVHPIEHASFAMSWKGIIIYNDPVGSSANPVPFAGIPKGELILISHSHGDHFSASAVSALRATNGIIIAPRTGVFSTLTTALRAATIVLTNGASTNVLGINIEAVPAYNGNHPRGDGNGYVVTIGGKRFYMAGDTGGNPEIRALQNIDVAFLCMNVPFTMDLATAVSVTRAFKPKVIYPYHFRNSGGTLTDLNAFKRQVGTDLGIEVRARKWY